MFLYSNEISKTSNRTQELMQQELLSLKKHNDQMEKTTSMLRETVKYKSEKLNAIKLKIKEYTV